jgi:hypothetical protein
LSRIISEILLAPEPQFSHTLKDWERICGYPSHDIRILNEAKQSIRSVLAELALDEEDTLPEELYYALQQKALKNSIKLGKILSISVDAAPDKVVESVSAFVDSSKINREIWTIKPSVLKQWLKKQPPKKLLKALKLKSIDSVLKRSKPAEILGLAYMVETPEWCAKMQACYKNLKATDFQDSKSTIIIVSKEYIEKLQKAGYDFSYHPVKPLYEAGVTLVFTPKQRFEGDVLAIAIGLLQSLINIKIYSAYFRFISVKNKFGSLLFDAVRQGFKHPSLKLGSIEWPIFQKHLVRSPQVFTAYEQPHFHLEAAAVPEVVDILVQVSPDFKFWQNTNAAVMEGKGNHVSCNLIDVVTNTVNRRKYHEGELGYMRARLWEELCLRYLEHEELEKHVFSEL